MLLFNWKTTGLISSYIFYLIQCLRYCEVVVYHSWTHLKSGWHIWRRRKKQVFDGMWRWCSCSQAPCAHSTQRSVLRWCLEFGSLVTQAVNFSVKWKRWSGRAEAKLPFYSAQSHCDRWKGSAWMTAETALPCPRCKQGLGLNGWKSLRSLDWSRVRRM